MRLLSSLALQTIKPALSVAATVAVAVSGLALSLLVLAVPAAAEPIAIPNGSFESPAVPFASPFVDAWQQSPLVDTNDLSTEVTGLFINQPPSDPTHIDNCDGSQCAFLFALPQTALFQDYDSVDYTSVPTHAFNAVFEPGKGYALTVAVLGGTNLSIPMQEGTTLELSLYYRDSGGNKVTVAATSVTNSGAVFTNGTHFVDYQVYVPTVLATDPWAGKHIGVQMLSTVAFELMGGYWDIDNVRLATTPSLLAPGFTAGHFSFSLQSQPGLVFEMFASTNLALPFSNWTSLGTLTNASGITPFVDPATSFNRRFYRARQLP
jgi:hypothetical protein